MVHRNINNTSKLYKFNLINQQIDSFEIPEIVTATSIKSENEIILVSNNGINLFDTNNKKFDPNFHQAMTEIENDKVGSYLRSHYKLAHEMNAIYLEFKKDISDGNIEKVIEVLYKKSDFTFFTLLKSFLNSVTEIPNLLLVSINLSLIFLNSSLFF